MGTYIAKRVLQFIPVFLGVTIILFVLQNVVPGDPIRMITGGRDVPEQTEEIMRINNHLIQVDEDGNITAVGTGTATVTATAEKGGSTAVCTITVVDDPAPQKAVDAHSDASKEESREAFSPAPSAAENAVGTSVPSALRVPLLVLLAAFLLVALCLLIWSAYRRARK